MTPHEQLPRAYLRKCEKFFQTIQDRLIKKKDAAVLFKHQATSTKLQAAGSRRDPDFLKKDKKDLTPTKSLI